ncbi:hypothetical protein Tco_0022782, partial [Tanacetum coccineum]
VYAVPLQRYTIYNTLDNEEEPTGDTSLRHLQQEDTAYPCPNFTQDIHDEKRAIRRIQENPYAIFSDNL